MYYSCLEANKTLKYAANTLERRLLRRRQHSSMLKLYETDRWTFAIYGYNYLNYKALSPRRRQSFYVLQVLTPRRAICGTQALTVSVEMATVHSVASILGPSELESGPWFRVRAGGVSGDNFGKRKLPFVPFLCKVIIKWMYELEKN